MNIIDKIENNYFTEEQMLGFRRLDLRSNELEVLPKNLTKFKNLEYLSLRANKLLDMAPLTLLENLEELMLYDNKIVIIPYSIGNLTKLKYINFVFNDVIYVSEKIGSLTELEIINASYNQIVLIPDSLGKLEKLHELKLRFNKITIIPKTIRGLISLKTLDLTGNQIENIPDELYNLTTLEKLWLGENQIVNVSNNITKLTNLKELILYGNLIKELPSNIGELTSLSKFYIHNNLITRLPASLGNLIFCNINIDHNPIEYIPPNVRRLLNMQNSNTIYEDTENVHDSKIQECIRKSINNILNDGCVNDDFLQDVLSSELNNDTKQQIVEYCVDPMVLASMQITFGELFKYVWDRIIYHENKDDMLSILSSEMNDVMCRCFVGRVSCLINVLSGFYSDVYVEISENAQVGSIVSLLVKQYDGEDLEQLKDAIRKELRDRGISEETIESWIEYVEL